MTNKTITKNGDNLTIGALEKGFRVLDAFSTSHPELGLSEIVGLTGLSKSSAQQYTHTLHRLGFLDKIPQSRRYTLAHKVLRHAHAFLSTNRLVERATPHVAELRRQFHNRVGFGYHDDTEVIYLIALQSNRAVYATAHPGFRIPVYCTATGKCILAFLPEDQAQDIINRSDRVKRTDMTVVDPEEIMEDVRLARAQGYATARNEFNPTEINISAPVFNISGTPVGAIATTSHSIDGDNAQRAEELIQALLEATRAISHQNQSITYEGI